MQTSCSLLPILAHSSDSLGDVVLDNVRYMQRYFLYKQHRLLAVKLENVCRGANASLSVWKMNK